MRNAFGSNTLDDSKLNTSHLQKKNPPTERNTEKNSNEYQSYIDFDELLKQ